MMFFLFFETDTDAGVAVVEAENEEDAKIRLQDCTGTKRTEVLRTEHIIPKFGPCIYWENELP